MTTNATAQLRGHVLVVEEEAGVRGLIGRALTGAGATVAEAGSSKEALAAIEVQSPDVVIVAFKLSGATSGAGLTRSLKAGTRTKGLPVLMLAPRANPEEVLACLDAGCDDVVAKPFIGPELIARVRTQLRARRLYEALERERKEVAWLHEMHDSMAATSVPEEVMEALVKVVAKILGVRRASIVLASRDPRYGYAVAASDKAVKNLQIDLSRYPEIARVMKTGRPLVVEEASASTLFAHLAEELKAAHIQSILAVPIVVDGEAVGSLLLHTKDDRRAFSQREVRLCAAAAQTAGLALRHSRVFGMTRGKPPAT